MILNKYFILIRDRIQFLGKYFRFIYSYYQLKWISELFTNLVSRYLMITRKIRKIRYWICINLGELGVMELKKLICQKIKLLIWKKWMQRKFNKWIWKIRRIFIALNKITKKRRMILSKNIKRLSWRKNSI